jgi:hypothetical protein
LAENALGEFRIHSSIGKRWYFLLLGRNSGFQFSYSDLAGFEFGTNPSRSAMSCPLSILAWSSWLWRCEHCVRLSDKTRRAQLPGSAIFGRKEAPAFAAKRRSR